MAHLTHALGNSQRCMMGAACSSCASLLACAAPTVHPHPRSAQSAACHRHSVRNRRPSQCQGARAVPARECRLRRAAGLCARQRPQDVLRGGEGCDRRALARAQSGGGPTHRRLCASPLPLRERVVGHRALRSDARRKQRATADRVRGQPAPARGEGLRGRVLCPLIPAAPESKRPDRVALAGDAPPLGRIA